MQRLNVFNVSELVLVSSISHVVSGALHDDVGLSRADDVDRVDVFERSAADLEHDDARITVGALPLDVK